MIEVDSEDVFYRYKYLPFNEGSLKVITEGTVKFTCPLSFNDPFDSRPVSIISRDVKKSDVYKRLVPAIPLAPAKRLALENRVANIIEKSISTGLVQQKVLQRIGVLSLSKKWNNVLMWSHYAGYHEGFVVGFRYIKSDIDDALEAFDIVPLPVKYTDERYVEDYTNDLTTNDAENALLIKGCDWKYEDEERVLDLKRGPDIHQYNRSARLHCVIAGAKITPENLIILKAAVKAASKELGRKILLKRAKLSDVKFSIELHD